MCNLTLQCTGEVTVIIINLLFSSCARNHHHNIVHVAITLIACERMPTFAYIDRTYARTQFARDFQSENAEE